jgi:hypothetical protein
VVDSAFSLTVPISEAVQKIIRKWSLEVDESHYSMNPTTVTVPWIVVEYVKNLVGSSITRDVHETHLLGSLEVALRLYEKLHIKLPVFGYLIDGNDITVYGAANGTVSAKTSTVPRR